MCFPSFAEAFINTFSQILCWYVFCKFFFDASDLRKYCKILRNFTTFYLAKSHERVFFRSFTAYGCLHALAVLLAVIEA